MTTYIFSDEFTGEVLETITTEVGSASEIKRSIENETGCFVVVTELKPFGQRRG